MVANYDEMMFGPNSWNSTYFAVSNSMVNSSGEPRTIAAAFSKNSATGNYITLSNAGIRYGASTSVTQLAVTQIWGII